MAPQIGSQASAQVEIIENELKSNPSDEAQWARLLGYKRRRLHRHKVT